MNGCRCPQCWSLHEFMQEITGKDYGLEPAPGCAHGPLPSRPQCTEQLTCTCPNCKADRTRLIVEAPRRAKRIRQPWEVDRAA